MKTNPVEKLKKELKGMPKNFIVGIIMPNNSYEDLNMNLLRYIINDKKSSGAYVSISKPYNHTLSLLKKSGISSNNIHFIDCITKGLGTSLQGDSKCTLVNGPSNLTELGIVLHNFFISSKEKNRFLYIDSISSLCIHNSLDSVLKFMHFITAKMRVFELSGVMLSMHEETDQKIISNLSQFCDKIVHL